MQGSLNNPLLVCNSTVYKEVSSTKKQVEFKWNSSQLIRSNVEGLRYQRAVSPRGIQVYIFLLNLTASFLYEFLYWFCFFISIISLHHVWSHQQSFTGFEQEISLRWQQKPQMLLMVFYTIDYNLLLTKCQTKAHMTSNSISFQKYL